MNIYYTIDEKYLKAIDKLYYNTPKAKILLEEILEMEPGYGKAHFKLGYIYSEYLAEYELAKKHYALAMKFEPGLLDIYPQFLSLYNRLEDHGSLLTLARKALSVMGVSKSGIYFEMGLSFEKQLQWENAMYNYRKAILHATSEDDQDMAVKALERIEKKSDSTKRIRYSLV